jgi:hypothetical protein
VSEPVLYRWPSGAHVGRVVPKTKFYEHSNVTAKTRRKFIEEVQRITWTHKLAEPTVHLAAGEGVPEIQVFVVEAKDEDVSDGLLAAIDRAIPFPVVFEVAGQHGGDKRVRTVAAYKQLRRSRSPTITAHFCSRWYSAQAPRRPLPTSLDLAQLYERLLRPLLPVRTSDQESVAAAAERAAKARNVEHTLERLERRLRNEPQFNRKVELRHQVRELEARLAKFTTPTN